MIGLNKKSLKNIGFLLIVLVLFHFSQAWAGMVQLPVDKDIKVSFDIADGKSIGSGELETGRLVLIKLEEPILVYDQVIVEKGANGVAEVLEVIKPAKPGKPGKIKVGFISLTPKGKYKSVDGSDIKLKGEIEASGKGKKFLSYLFIFGLFIKGGQAELSSTAIYTVQIAESIRMTDE